LYDLLGVSCFWGLAATCLFLPLNHFAGKVVVGAQNNRMKARDERVSLMNEILGGIRMIKFMAWERSFEARVHKIREKELTHERAETETIRGETPSRGMGRRTTNNPTGRGCETRARTIVGG